MVSQEKIGGDFEVLITAIDCQHHLEGIFNFRAPDLSRIVYSGGPDIKGTYKNCRKIKRKFKMQQYL